MDHCIPDNRKSVVCHLIDCLFKAVDSLLEMIKPLMCPVHDHLSTLHYVLEQGQGDVAGVTNTTSNEYTLSRSSMRAWNSSCKDGN